MNTVVGLLVIVAVAFVGAGRLFESRRLPTIVRQLLGSGFVFVLLGALLGPQGTGMLDRAALQDLEPLLHLSTGWIGLLFGLEMRREHLARYPDRWTLGAVVHAALVTLLVLLLVDRLVPLLAPRVVAGVDRPLAVMLALLAAISAPAVGHLFRRPERRDHALTLYLRFHAGISTLVAVLVFGVVSGAVALAGSRSGHLPGGAAALALTLVSAAVLAVLFRTLVAVQRRDAESYVISTGFVVLCSGTALYLGVSTVFLSLLCGVLIAHTGGSRRHLRGVLRRLERPMYLMLFLLAGASWTVPNPEIALLAVLFVLGRLGAHWLAGLLSPPAAGEPVPGRHGIGVLMLSQGGIALALVLDEQRFLGWAAGAVLLNAVLLGVLLKGLYHPIRMRRLAALWRTRG